MSVDQINEHKIVIFFINVDVQVSLRASRLIPQALKLTIM
jgi:hypothetical protein